MRPIRFMAIISAAALMLPPAVAQEISDAPPIIGALHDQPVGENSPDGNHHQPAAGHEGRRDPQSRIGAGDGWRMSFDGQRPSIENRLSDRATLRLRGMNGGAGILLHWRF